MRARKGFGFGKNLQAGVVTMQGMDGKEERGLLVRRADADDLDRLADLFEQVHHLHADLYPKIYRKTDWADLNAEMAALMNREGIWVHVADSGGEVLGYVLSRLEECAGDILLHPYRFLFLEQIAVDKSHLRRGVGTLLFQRAKTLAADLKASQIHLLVWSRNEASLRFFEKHGFSDFNRRMVLEVE